MEEYAGAVLIAFLAVILGITIRGVLKTYERLWREANNTHNNSKDSSGIIDELRKMEDRMRKRIQKDIPGPDIQPDLPQDQVEREFERLSKNLGGE